VAIAARCRWDSQMVFTAVSLTLDLREGTLSCASGAHPAPLRRHNQAWQEIDVIGAYIGSAFGIPFAQTTVPFERGDAVYVFSDGAFEERDPNKQMFGRNRLIEAITAAEREGNTAGARLVADLATFRGDGPRSDDFTFVSARWHRGLSGR
jgi:serine phosphatase RsbU (regulator of sigma subunit)